MKKWLIAHSKTGNVQDELRTSCYSRKQVLSKMITTPCQKSKEANSAGQSGTMWASVRIEIC